MSNGLYHIYSNSNVLLKFCFSCSEDIDQICSVFSLDNLGMCNLTSWGWGGWGKRQPRAIGLPVQFSLQPSASRQR